MKVLHTADLHAGLARYPTPGQPHARLADTDAILTRFIRVAAEKRVDLAIFAGDTFDTRNPSPRVLDTVVRRLRELSEACDVVVVPGNHDGMWTIGDPTSHTLAWLASVRIPRVHVLLQPQTASIAGASVVAFPYPHKRAYDNRYPGMDPDERHARLSQDLEQAIEVLYMEALTHGGPSIFVGHLTAVGSRVGSERTMRLEDDVSVGSRVLDLFDYAALGHIHKQQPIGDKAWYPGSPGYVDFGEADGFPKSFLLADVLAKHAPVIERIPTNARPMWDIDFPGDDPSEPEVPPGTGPLVRLRGRYPDRAAAAAGRRALVPRWYDAGAAHVQWDPEVPQAERSSERALSAATAPLDAVRSYFTTRGQDPEPYIGTARDIMEGPA